MINRFNNAFWGLLLLSLANVSCAHNERVTLIPMPNIMLTQPDGSLVQLDTIIGNGLILYYYGTDCDACNNTFATLKAIYPKIKAKGYEIVAIPYFNDTTKWSNYLQAHPMPWLNGVEQGNFSKAMLNIHTVPAIYFVNSTGSMSNEPIQMQQLTHKF